MSLLPALEDTDNNLDHGWSQANRFSVESPSSQPEGDIDDWPNSELPTENYEQTQSTRQAKNWSDLEHQKPPEHWQHQDTEGPSEEWEEGESPETQEHWQHTRRLEEPEDWDKDESSGHCKDWLHSNRQKDIEDDSDREESEDSEEGLDHPDRQKTPEDWQQEEIPAAQRDWHQNVRPKTYEEWKELHSSTGGKTWHHSEEQETEENWQEEESKEIEQQWQPKDSPEQSDSYQQEDSPSTSDEWRLKLSPTSTEGWDSQESNEIEEPPESRKNFKERELKDTEEQDQLSPDNEEWPEIDLPEPEKENNRQPIIQEIREEEIVSVPTDIINLAPGTPQATVIATSKGQSILVHSEGDKYIIVSAANKQSPQSMTQYCTIPSTGNLYELLTKKDNPQTFRPRTPIQQQRFVSHNRGSLHGIVSNPRLRFVAAQGRGQGRGNTSYIVSPQVSPHVSPSKGNTPTYLLPNLIQGIRGRGRGNPSVRGDRGRGSNRGRAPRTARGRGRQQMYYITQGTPGNQYSNQVNNISSNQIPRNASPQIGGPSPRIIRYKVTQRLPHSGATSSCENNIGSSPRHQFVSKANTGVTNQIPSHPSPQIIQSKTGATARIIRCTTPQTSVVGNKNLQIVTTGENDSQFLQTSDHRINQEETSLADDDEKASTSRSLTPSQMIVDHEYAAPDPTCDNSKHFVDNCEEKNSHFEDEDSLDSDQHNTVGFTNTSTVSNTESSQSSNDCDQNPALSQTAEPSPNKLNTISIGGGNLEKNTVYMIKINGQDHMKIWDGENFQDYDSTKYTITSETPVTPGNMSGGGVGDKGKQIRGNATGLNMVQNRSNVSMVVRPVNNSPATTKSSTTNSNPGVRNDVLPNGRTWKYTSPQPSKDNLARRPLHSDSGGGLTAIIIGNSPNKPRSITVVSDSSSLSSQQSTSSSDSQGVQKNVEDRGEPNKQEQDQSLTTEESKKRKRLQESGFREGECVVHCKFCGYSSSNILSCDRCHRTFPDDIKITPIYTPLVKKGRTCDDENEKTNVAIDKKAFYGQKMAEQSQVYQKIFNDANVPTGRRINVQGRSYRMVRLTSGTPRRKPAAPVTVTISSDEEEEPLSRPGSVGSSGATEDGESLSLSQVIADIPNTGPPSPKFNSGRVKKMEDEMGNAVLVRKVARKNQPTNVIPINRTKVNKPNHVTVNNLPVSGQQVTFYARSIRIGSLRGTPIEPILVSEAGVFFFFECEDNSYNITIEPQDVDHCLICLKRRSVMFLKTFPEFGQKLRTQLGMTSDATEPYFDPQGSDMRHQYISFIMQENNLLVEKPLTSIISQFESPGEEKQKAFVKILSFEEADELLVKTSPEQVQNFLYSELQNYENKPAVENQMEVMNPNAPPEPKAEERERSPSPKIMFTGPVEKLITYPPPPATGGITVTNEDLFCLTEGEFLNDVIIDFYLKYLMLELLSEEDRKRTHIFSSFFFKRLTQRHAARPEEASMTPAEKRHSRVKTWTKHVDLFKKDFIIVPINEHSHWFLAIICFPGLLKNETVMFIPKNRQLSTNIQFNNSLSEVPKQENSESDKSESTEPQKMEVQSSEGQNESQDEGQGQQQTQEAEESGNNQQKENHPGEEMELEPGEIPMDSSNVPPPILSARYFCKEARGQRVLEEDIKDPILSKYIVSGQRQPCIMVFDSLSGVSRSRIVNILKEYLQVEWAKKKDSGLNLKERLRGGSPKVPQQTNYSDCGVYLLQYVESFFQDPIQDFSLPMKLQSWFTEERIRRKREEIKELILTISELQKSKS